MPKATQPIWARTTRSRTRRKLWVVAPIKAMARMAIMGNNAPL